MHIQKWILGLAILLVAALPAAAQSAHADIMNDSGQKIGEAKFHQPKDGVSISLNVSQIPPGTHGVHIHAAGQCIAPDFKTAGAHFNPDNKQHGAKNPQARTTAISATSPPTPKAKPKPHSSIRTSR